MNRNASPVIVTEGLTRRFGALTAVDSLNLAVYPGEVLGFLGHNGAGKTTTVRLLNGVLTPSAGKARVLGLDPATEGATLRRRTGVLTETPSLDERLTAREQLRIYADFYDAPPQSVGTRVDELLEIFQLADRGDERVSTYSRGMKQRLALARALLHRPALLFLDEPTAGLDPVSARQVHTLIREQSRSGDHTVFLCTHNLEEAQRLCHRVAVLERGRIVALGAPTELGRNLWKGVRLEVETSPEAVTSACAALQQFASAREVTQPDERPILTLALSDREEIPRLVAHLAAAEIPIYRLTPREPTLEDVYFALHERKEESR